MRPSVNLNRAHAAHYALLGAISAIACGCDSGQSLDDPATRHPLSHAANNANDQGAWSFDGTNMDERWSEDPTVMEPDFPFAGSQPGFGSQGLGNENP